MIIVTDDKTPNRAPGEYAPMLTAEVADLLRGAPSAAWTLYVDAMSRPSGWQLTGRQRAKELGLTEYKYRQGITWLVKVGLYLVDRVRDAMGRFTTWCRFLASPHPSPQVTPEAGLPEGGGPPRIPICREKKKRGGVMARTERAAHLPENCQREAEGKACRQCGKTRREREKADQIMERTEQRRRLTMAQILGDPRDDCEHGNPPHACAWCRQQARAQVNA
jgi:hypothetical protein